jgi:hypothetical protein
MTSAWGGLTPVPKSSSTYSSMALGAPTISPGFLPARCLGTGAQSDGLMPQPSSSAWTVCPGDDTLSLSQPLDFFFSFSDLSLAPAAPQEPAVTSWVPAHLVQHHAVPPQWQLPSAGLARLRPQLPPHSCLTPTKEDAQRFAEPTARLSHTTRPRRKQKPESSLQETLYPPPVSSWPPGYPSR